MAVMTIRLRTIPVILLVMALLAPVASAQPAPASASGNDTGPPSEAEGERGITQALEHVPDFVGDLLGEIASWFR